MTTKGLRQRLRRRHAKTEGILKQVQSWTSGPKDGPEGTEEPRRLDAQEPGLERDLKDRDET